ncbi:MAG: right-handed parallel beta-helix repeat-containing protein [Candidatus Krumholzibacteriia bacterium]|nr:right-handed parallel beta-helix repeat-containing protein [bacterium]
MRRLSPEGPRLLLLVGLALGGQDPSPLRADTIQVPGDQPTLAAAIAAAAGGDSILLAPGTYYEHSLVISGPLAILGESGRRSDVVIDAESQGRVLLTEYGEWTLRLQDLTLQHGWAGSEVGGVGGGAYLQSRGLVRNVTVRACSAHWFGGGIAAYGPIELLDSLVEGNSVAGPSCLGGGLILGVDAYVARTAIRSNTSASDAGGVYCSAELTALMEDCTIIDNHADRDGGGLYAYDTEYFHDLRLVRSLVSGNSAGRNGGGAYSFADLRIESCTLVDNSAADGAGAYMSGNWDIQNTNALINTIVFGNHGIGVSCWLCQVAVGCSDVYGNEGGDYAGFVVDPTGTQGNISVDPRFCSFATEDFRLEDTSPCAPGNHPDGHGCEVIGLYGVGCTGTAVAPSHWGTIKSYYSR